MLIREGPGARSKGRGVAELVVLVVGHVSPYAPDAAEWRTVRDQGSCSMSWLACLLISQVDRVRVPCEALRCACLSGAVARVEVVAVVDAIAAMAALPLGGRLEAFEYHFACCIESDEVRAIAQEKYARVQPLAPHAVRLLVLIHIIGGPP